jgi:hypothetical protein
MIRKLLIVRGGAGGFACDYLVSSRLLREISRQA